MATKKTAKKTAKMAAKKKASGQPSNIEIELTRAQHGAAKRCLETSGKIRIGLKELSVTKLPNTVSPAHTIVDVL